MRVRFEGSISGIGTSSGTRLVVGMWSQSPFGPIVDVMVEHPDGHRTLIAPAADTAQFIASTYRFDDVRIEPTTLTATARSCVVSTPSLQLAFDLGRRTLVGWLLWLVPLGIARSTMWCQAIAPLVRVVRPGVRTVGTAGGGRREFYCATDEHAVTGVRAMLDGVDLGGLRPVRPPVHFGFGSAPARPALVRVRTIIEQADTDSA